MKYKAVFSKNHDNWATPTKLLEELHKEYNFNDDPCPLGGNDGLKRTWGKRVFCNPPYSDIPSWLQKAEHELFYGDTELVVFLLPSRTDTKWFHNHIYGKREIQFIKGRLKYNNSKQSAPFPSMLVFFRK